MSKKCLQFLNNVTIEPAFCLFTIVFVIVDSTFTNLVLQKACRSNCTSEPDLSAPCDDEKRGILLASEVNSFYHLVMHMVCGFYSIMAVSWSDIAGRRRRPVIFLPIIGLFLQSLAGCLHTYFWTWAPLHAAQSYIAGAMMTGGVTMMSLISFTYICDVTDVKTRMMSLGLLTAARTFGDLVGFSSSGFILRGVGFFYTFLCCATLSLAAFVLAVVFVKDVSVPLEKKPHLCQCFNLMRLVDCTKVVYKKSLGRSRIVVTMLLAIYALVFSTTQGERSVQYLFLRYKFHWDERDYSFYVFYRYIGVIIGSVFCSVVLSKILQVHDGLIGMFAIWWDAMAALGYLFANQTWHLFVVPLFDVFHGTAFTACCAFYSKYYTSDEFGRLHSFLGILAFVIPISLPAYNEIFRRTLDVFPSAYFILSIAVNVIIFLLYWKSYSMSRKLQIQKPLVKEAVPMIAVT